MKVILTQDVKNIGKRSDIKDVKDGYAMHFLIPKNLAKMATQANVDAVRAQEEKLKAEQAKRFEGIKKQMNKLSNLVLDLSVKASEEGTLFAKLTAKDIAKGIRDKGFDLDDEHIVLKSAIKTTGEYDIPVSYGNDLPDVKVKVHIKAA